jgi:hypothetical protein
MLCGTLCECFVKLCAIAITQKTQSKTQKTQSKTQKTQSESQNTQL